MIVAWCEFDAPIDGVTMSVRDLPSCIFLNSTVPPDRMRLFAAHELGHVIMHRIPMNEIEEEANAFAGEFLVPERAFKRSMLGQRITLEWLARQKAFWRVSMAFLLYRACLLNLITRHQSEYLWKRLSALGWRTREPAETDFSYERPTIFPGLVRFHSEDLAYSVDELRALLSADDSDVWRLYGAHLGGKGRLRVVK